MEWIREHGLRLAFLGGYLALLAYFGWMGKKRSRSLAHYLIGGRALGGVVIALSFYATFVSSVTFVGHAGRSYTLGPSWWITCVVVFSSLAMLAWFVVAPRFMEKAWEYGSLTIPDFLGYRYGSLALRRLAGLVVVAASLAYMVAVYVGAVRALESLLGASQEVIVAGVFLVVTSYTLAGGFYSVVATDAVQGLILLAGGLLMPVTMIVRKGGLGPLLGSVRANDPSALQWAEPIQLFTMIGLALGLGLKFLVEPRQLSRFYGLASQEELRRGRWIAPTLLLVTYLCMLPVGFLAHGFVGQSGEIEADEVVPYLLGDGNLLGPVAGAFFLTGLIAAAMSSVDSVLLVAASSVDHDLIAPKREDAAAMRFTRLWVVLLSAAAAGLALRAPGIVEMSAFSGSIYAACFLPGLVLGLFWHRGTAAGALASLMIGLVVTMFWFFAKEQIFAELHEVYVGLAVSLPTYFVVSLYTQKR